MTRRDDRLDRLWLDLRECLLEGGAREDQIGAMRAAFFCGAHACVVALSQGGPDACDALMAELRRELGASDAAVRRMGLH
jgi:hypothetical protein